MTAARPGSGGYRRVIVGGPGSGKSELAREIFLESLRTHGPDRVWFILAASSMADHTRALLAEKLGAIPDRNILTFDRLLREKLPAQAQRIVEPRDLEPVIRKILADFPSGPLADIVALPGFGRIALARFVEWRELGLTPDDLSRAAQSDPRREILVGLYQRFLDALAEKNFLVRRMAQEMLAGQIRERPEIRPRAAVFDGFYDLTPGQNEIFAALAGCGDIEIAFTLPGAPGDFSRFGFADVRRMHERLRGLGFETVTAQHAERAACATLRHLGSSVFRKDATAISEADFDRGCFQIARADNIEIECEYVARRIARTLEDEGPVRIGVVCRSFASYAQPLQTALDRERVPYVLHGGLRAADGAIFPLFADLLSILAAQRDAADFDPDGRRRVLGLLRLLASDAARDAADRFELSEKAPWTSEPSKLAEHFADIEDARRVLERLADLRARFQSASDTAALAGVAEDALRLIAAHALGDIEIPSARPGIEMSARVLAALHSEIADFRERFKDEVLTPEDFAELLLEHLADAPLPPQPAQTHAVHVVDALEARSWAWHTAFIVGMTQGVFPLSARPDPFLSEEMRKRLTAAGAPMKPESDRREEEALLFHLALTRASDRLILTCPRLDFSGRDTEPSQYLDEIARALGDRFKSVRFDVSKTLARPIWPLEILDGAAARNDLLNEGALRTGRHLRVGEAADAADGVWRRLFDEKLAPSRFVRTGEALAGGLPFQWNGEASLKAYRNSLKHFSASQVGVFRDCPFLHLVQKALRPSELSEPLEISDAAFRGTVLHEILARFFGQGPPPQINEKGVRGLLADELKKQAPHLDPAKDPLVRTKLYELASSLHVFIATEIDRLEKSAFSPSPEGAELKFYELPVVAPSGRSFPFTGRIDRLDIAKNNQDALVIDYKTGGASEIPPDPKEGLTAAFIDQPQLAVYMLAAKKLLGYRPAGAAYFNLRKNFRSGVLAADPLFDQSREKFEGPVVARDELERVLGEFESMLGALCEKIVGGEIAPDYGADACRYCAYGALCRRIA